MNLLFAKTPKLKLKYLLPAILIILVLILETPIIATGLLAKPVPSDVIIVLGSRVIGQEPGLMLTPRLQEALRLYHLGYAPAIIVSGAQGADEENSEAAVMSSYLCKNGVPADVILLEDKSFNTWQNLSNSQKLMQQHGFNTAIIISSQSHLCRALLLANRLGISASAAGTAMTGGFWRICQQYVRESAALLYLCLFNKP